MPPLSVLKAILGLLALSEHVLFVDFLTRCEARFYFKNDFRVGIFILGKKRITYSGRGDPVKED